MTKVKIKIRGDGLLVYALLLYLDRRGIAGMALLCCALHELGHIFAIYLLGGRVSALELTVAGAALKLSASHPLPPGRMTTAALAGPGMNLLLSMAGVLLVRLGGGERLYLFSGLNLGLAVFNLLPCAALDGGRALEAVLSRHGRSSLGRRITEIGSWGVPGFLVLFGGLLAWQSGGRNFTALLAGIWLLGVAVHSGGKIE